MREWVTDCLDNHPSCAKQSAGQNDSNCPARLLDLTSLENNGLTGIRLVETIPGLTYGYACLSHRWDDAVHACRTTAETIARSLRFIDLDALPLNFRDAVIIARHAIFVDRLSLHHPSW
jgi:hypothetical protein